MEKRMGRSGFGLIGAGLSRFRRSLADGVVRRLRPHWIRDSLALAGYERVGPLERMTLPQGGRLAVVAPHPDDESIGAGGLIALWVQAGRRAQVVVATDGAAGHPALRAATLTPADRAALVSETTVRRRTECDAALRVLGAQGRWLDGTDGELWRDEARLVRALEAEWKVFRPDCLVVPFPADRHRDHAVAARIAARAGMAALPEDTTVLCYEVWSPCPANVVLDISAVAAEKDRAIACHASQIASTDYVMAVQGLNQYRAITAGLPSGSRAEAFHRCTLAELAALCARLKV